ncbi:MAG: hypothetical protein PHD82_05690 [Candidatus Riflebacteria bacterium]|jgi:hypothetical protein|nr:hypothetical protein [Candidatus Riflebacteria bacterium]
MASRKLFGALFLAFLFVSLVTAAQAAVYGYIVVRGKNIDHTNREIETIERLIKTWPNGEVLHKHSVVSGGAFFFKKITATIFFAGNQKDISGFLTQGPYEGDYVKDVVVQFNYNSRVSESAFDGDINTTYTRKFANIRKALETIQGKDAKILWNDLKEGKAKEYKKHLVADKLIDPSVNIIFYSVQPVEENRLFGISFTPGNVTPRQN